MTSLGLGAKPALMGLSRGGLPVYNWSSRNPDKVSCIYADNPVCDPNSWPFCRGETTIDEPRMDCAIRCAEAYGMADVNAKIPEVHIPYRNLKPLAEAGVPLIHVCGDADEVVPFPENSQKLQNAYNELGGTFEMIIKPGGLHHPHCLEDPTPVVEFICKYAL
jgi:alpha-beta hydrolase superfamily lysophospholipase